MTVGCHEDRTRFLRVVGLGRSGVDSPMGAVTGRCRYLGASASEESTVPSGTLANFTCTIYEPTAGEKLVKSIKNNSGGWGQSSVEEHLPSTCKALGSIPSTMKYIHK